MRRLLIPLLCLGLLAGCSRQEPSGDAPAPAEAPAPTKAPSPAAPTSPAKPPAPPPAPRVPEVLELAWAPDSERLALVTPEGLLVRRGPLEFQPWPLKWEAGYTLVGWRGDGQAIYFTDKAGNLVESAAGGTTRQMAAEPGARYIPSPAGDQFAMQGASSFRVVPRNAPSRAGSFVSWSPTGHHYIYNTPDGQSRLVETAAEKETPLPLGGGLWAPNGERIYLRGKTGGGIIYTVASATAAPAPAAGQVAWSADGQRLVYTDDEGFWTINADGTDRQLLMRGRVEGIQQLVWLAQDEILLTIVGKTAGGGTKFDVCRISNGRLAVLDSYTRFSLYPSPDLKRVAYIAGPPFESEPGSMSIYP